MAARRKGRDEWAAIVAAFEGSGEPAAKFCARRGIRVGTLKWWRWRVRGRRCGATALARSNDVRLVPVDVVGLSAARPSAVTIALADLELRVEVGTEVTYVAELVGELRSRC
jgi:hypothetical protein